MLKLWLNGEKEKVEKMVKEMTNYDIDDDYYYQSVNSNRDYNVEFANVLIDAMMREMYDFFHHIKSYTITELYRIILYHAAFLGDKDVVKKLRDNINDNLTLTIGSYYQSIINEGYQRGGHYHLIFPAISLKELVDGRLETVVSEKKKYVKRVVGIINNHKDHKLFDSLNKDYWTSSIYNTFYHAACMKKNLHIVEKIEELVDKINFVIDHEHQLLRCVMFDKFDDLQSLLLKNKATGNAESSRQFGKCLLETIFRYGRNNLGLVDFLLTTLVLVSELAKCHWKNIVKLSPLAVSIFLKVLDVIDQSK
jgi:hypothetical protein